MFGKLLTGLRGKPVTIDDAPSVAEGQARLARIDGPDGEELDVILCRVGGVLRALDVRCPHADGRIIPGPLAEGKYAVCPLHNYQFKPKSGAVRNASCKKARTYRVRESQGRVEIWLS